MTVDDKYTFVVKIIHSFCSLPTIVRYRGLCEHNTQSINKINYPE